MDETGVEPMTFCLQGRRATNYATRPLLKFYGSWFALRSVQGTRDLKKRFFKVMSSQIFCNLNNYY